ncbi:hypothetical protein NEUTE2DRAFT_79257 [Neurospora tetrasperma FGSC 2509]|nr:hypothetical protein NEUTE2DRAFT_79257 [Neurospora tetrasperma FGSC 2509]
MPPITTVARFVDAVTNQKRGEPFDSDDATSIYTGGRLLIIILSSAIPVVAISLAAIVLCLCWRKKRRQIRVFSRTVTPVDDEEIATWKIPKSEEAGFTTMDDTDVDGKSRSATGDRLNTSHGKQPSTSSVKKPASVIVYINPEDQAAGETRKSFDEGFIPRSAAHSTHSGYYGRTSIDHTPLPPTPILARAPNSRAGLTDDTVPGDVPFILTPKRQPSRLHKLPPGAHAVVSSPGPRHGRKKSSKSSTSSIGGYSNFNNNNNYHNNNRAAYYRGGGYTSDTGKGFPGRHSIDHARTRSMHHSRLQSGVTVPPRLSLGDDALSRRQFLREEEIGRAIG